MQETSYDKLKFQNSELAEIFLVGAGPGSADLLTVKALNIIQSCDVILYDNLVSEEIRQLFPQGTKKVFVGKSKNSHSMSQASLNQLMINLYRKGHRVCRLKGGDPFVFGRGSEEMLALHDAGVRVQVVPGITAASGASSYAGIPLTHRGVSQGCTFISAHAEKECSINWESLAKLDHTLVFYMGLSKLVTISQQLVKFGLSPSTPSALIENGTQTKQRVVSTTLSNLEQAAQMEQLISPTLIVIGDVVELSQQLAWYETENDEQRSFENIKQRLSA